MQEYTCEVCGQQLHYSGRGRPPKRCDEHKNAKIDKDTTPPAQGKKEGDISTRARPRPRPQASSGEKEQRSVGDQPQEGKKREAPPLGKSDTQSRAKAEGSARRTQEQATDETWPVGSNGRPMAKIIFSVSELIPTGQYANVSVGPAQIHTFVDLDRATGDDEGYFSAQERQVLIKSMNELAGLLEHDVVAVQRNLVLESIQEQLGQNGN